MIFFFDSLHLDLERLRDGEAILASGPAIRVGEGLAEAQDPW